MGMWQAGDAPTLTSRSYLLFGKVSVTVQAAKGPGLITALVMKSDSGDEIDWVRIPMTVPDTDNSYRSPGASWCI